MPNIQAARLIDNLRRLSYLDLETVKRIAQDPDLVWRPVNKFTCETAEFVILASGCRAKNPGLAFARPARPL